MSTLPFRQPRIVALILLVLVSAGLSAFLSIGRQEDPTITNLFATVTTQFPGADPARVEALVSAEIEEQLREIAEVDTVTSVSRTGVSVVSVELLETLDETTIEQVWSEARDAVEDARRNFPQGVLAPEFDAEGISAYSAVIAVTADHDGVPLTLTHAHAESLADRLRAIPATRAVDLFGEPEEEVLVEIDPYAAAAIGLTVAEVSGLITAADGKVRAGSIDGEDTGLTINVSGEITALERLGRVVLREGADGATVTVADVATLSRGPRAPATELAYANGRPAVLVGVLARDGVQIDRWMGFVREELAEGAALVPQGLTESLIFDQSTYTADRLTEVGTNMAIGVALVVAVLFVTLGLRAAAIVALVLPVVSLATLATMNFIGLPIHQMSVTGLIVALGLLVDAAIVMVDEVRQRLARGMAREAAVGDAVKRLAAPLLASTVTTALSFTPMILLPGPAGDFVGSIAIAVVIMLIWSLFIALTVTPAFAGWFIKSGGRGGISIPALTRAFTASIRWSALNPAKSIALALILPVMGFAAFPTLTAQFFPGVDRDQFYLEVTASARHRAQRHGRGRARHRRRAARDRRHRPRLLDRRALGSRVLLQHHRRALAGAGLCHRHDHQRHGRGCRAPGAAVAGPSRRRLPAGAYHRARAGSGPARGRPGGGPTGGPRPGRPAQLRRSGPRAHGRGSHRHAGAHGRLWRGAAGALRYRRDGGAASGAQHHRYRGAAGKRHGRDDGRQPCGGHRSIARPHAVRPRRLHRPGRRVGPPDPVAGGGCDLHHRNLPGGAPVGACHAHPGTRRERHHPPQRGTGERGAGLHRARRPARRGLAGGLGRFDAAGFALPPGYRMELGGDSDARSSTVGNLLASIGLIVTLTIATIALTFNSFRLTVVALVVCVLSAGLSMLSLAVLQYPFGINAIIGVIGSIGVSINAAIIIMTGLQADPEAASGEADAIARVVTGSSRHIVSTTITTFGGFLPLILEGGGFWPPFAVAIAGGVLLSAVVSFYFTPPVFRLVYRKRRAARDGAYAGITRLPVAAE
jgi:multidrug efflux pump subunit AcrB